MTLAAPIQPPQADSGMTYGEMLLHMAARYGSAHLADDGSEATLPESGTEEYRQLAAAFQRGYSRFLRRRDWTFIDRELEYTLVPLGTGPYNIDGDPARYRIPHWARAIPTGNWTYTDANAGYSCVKMRPVEEVRHLLAQDTGNGTPQWAGIGPIQSRGVAGTDWELVLWPSPGAIYRIRATFRMSGHKLTRHEQRHIAGAEHDEAILCEAMWALYESDVASPERDGSKSARDEAIADSIRIDIATTLGNKGSLVDTGLPREQVRTAWGVPDLYVNGVKLG